MESVSASLRRLIVARAEERCEYCLTPQSGVFYKHEVDHIVPRQHGGETNADNLAVACFHCNRNKGPNLGSLDPETRELVGFFHPRRHHWLEHFKLENGIIHPLTPEARVTAAILRLNDEDRVAERRALIVADLYRPPE